jgi:hypothetical protein
MILEAPEVRAWSDPTRCRPLAWTAGDPGERDSDRLSKLEQEAR